MKNIDELRIEAGIDLEDSFESGSKYCVGDKELEAFRQLCREERDEELRKQKPVAGIYDGTGRLSPWLSHWTKENYPYWKPLYAEPIPPREPQVNK